MSESLRIIINDNVSLYMFRTKKTYRLRTNKSLSFFDVIGDWLSDTKTFHIYKTKYYTFHFELITRNKSDLKKAYSIPIDLLKFDDDAPHFIDSDKNSGWSIKYSSNVYRLFQHTKQAFLHIHCKSLNAQKGSAAAIPKFDTTICSKVKNIPMYDTCYLTMTTLHKDATFPKADISITKNKK